MHFLVFVPGPRAGALERAGLVDLAPGAQLTSSEGPDAQRGTLVTWGTPDRPQRAAYLPTEQEWVPALEAAESNLPAGRYWVGIWKRSVPRERDLRRRIVLDSRLVRLGNGEDWLIPTLDGLPSALLPAANETWVRVPLAEFAEYRAAGQILVSQMRRFGAGKPLSVPLLAEFMTQGLRLNYRITREVIALLWLFNEKQFEGIIPAAADLAGVELPAIAEDPADVTAGDGGA